MASQSIDIKSALRNVVEVVDTISDFESKKVKAIELVSKLKIKDEDRRRMLMIIQYQCTNNYQLTQYLYNSMLKYEGLGTFGNKS